MYWSFPSRHSQGYVNELEHFFQVVRGHSKSSVSHEMTMAITNDLRMRYGIGVSLNSIQGSQVRIAIKTNEVIKRQEFSDFMDQLVKELPISYFTMQETTLDQVFSKLIQQDKAQFVDFDISHTLPLI